MATGDQLRVLLRSYIEGDEAHFFSIAMQLAAAEARQGHGKLAEELRELIDEAKRRRPSPLNQPIPIARPRGELASLLRVAYPKTRLSDLVVTSSIHAKPAAHRQGAAPPQQAP